MENNAASVREVFEAMSTEQLDEILNRELHTDPPDLNAIRLILDVLWQREKDMPLELTPQMQEAWDKYRRDVDRISKHSARACGARHIFKRILSTAAVLALVFLLFVPQKVQAGSLWDWFTRLTADVAEFFSPSDTDDRIIEYTFQTDNPGLQQVYDLAVEHGIDFPAVPMWLPGDFELVECRVMELDSKIKIGATFMDDSQSFVISFEIYDQNVAHTFEKDESKIKIKEIEGEQFTILRNNDMWTSIWSKDNTECFIAIDCQEEELYRILKSIYLMEE